MLVVSFQIHKGVKRKQEEFRTVLVNNQTWLLMTSSTEEEQKPQLTLSPNTRQQILAFQVFVSQEKTN